MTTAPAGRPDDPPRVAFTVGRAVGNAVTRNRVRRRLRAAVRTHAALLEPGRAYLWKAQPRARDATYSELSTAVRATLTADSESGAR